MFALKWPWVAGHRKGKEKMKPNDWRGTPNGSGVPFPSTKKYKKKSFWTSLVADGRQPFSLRAKDKRLRHERSESLKPALKSNTKSTSPWKKRNSPVEPRQKNKISNFGTFSFSPKLCLPLSLNLKKDKSQEKTFIFMDYPITYFWHFEHIYVYNRSKELMYFNFTMWVYAIIPCFPFSFYSPCIILLRTVLLIPKVSHGKPELPTTTIAVLILLQPKTYRLTFFHYLGERRKRPGGCVIVWNLEPLASGGQSGLKLFPHVICQFLSAWEKNSEQDLFL